MIVHGIAPFLECSSRGDSRFSAFSARIRARGNKSVEEIYQAAKEFEDGRTGLTWREAKGRRATNMAEVSALYATLWSDYMAENPQLLPVLLQAGGLKDMFGQPGHCCQATQLWRIRCEALGIEPFPKQPAGASAPKPGPARTLFAEAASIAPGRSRRFSVRQAP